jgi:putative transposase
LNDGSCIRVCPEYPGHVWAYDFVEGRTHDGRKFCILTIIARGHLPMSGQTMALNLSQRRSRNGSPKSASQPSASRPVRLGKNGCNESFNGSLRDELLNGEMVHCLAEAKVLTKAWRRQYNTVRPHRSLPLPTTGTRSRSIASAVLRFRYASPPANTGDGGSHSLTIRPAHSLGADQWCQPELYLRP